ncbi:unnamed protein product [Rhizopus stolonifer]
MFHSSSFRHEQYRVRSTSGSKHTLHKQLPSLDSKISADTDSECSSSSSSPSYSTVSSPTSTGSFSANTIHTSATSVNGSERVVKKPTNPRRKKRVQNNRTPDLVYSCPRPLAFPFHNDDHFLPIAEADPRDVARVSPSVNRAYSIQSKDSIRDTESSYSRHSSILSSIQQGTVSTIRSLFQLPNSITSSLQFTQPTTTANHKYQPLERIEIKQGTVQSLKDFFSPRQEAPLKKDKPKTDSELESQPEENESLYSRASRVLWGNSPEEDTEEEEPKKTFASEIKKFSVRVISNLLPTTKPKEKDLNHQTKQEPSKVGKLWNSFKSLWSSQKSKVGPISI